MIHSFTFVPHEVYILVKAKIENKKLKFTFFHFFVSLIVYTLCLITAFSINRG